MRSALNVVLLLALLLVLALNWVIRPDPSARNSEVMAEMVNSVAAEAQAENLAVKGGNTSLAPVPGTIARGFMPIRYAATPDDAKRAGDELVNPFAADDRKALARGQVVFGNMCASCHGATGLGDGPVTKRGFPPPPSLLAENAMALKDGQLFHIITYGQKNMPAHATQVDRDDRWNVTLYIRDLQKKSVAAAAEPAAQAANAALPAAVEVPTAAGEAPPATVPAGEAH